MAGEGRKTKAQRAVKAPELARLFPDHPLEGEELQFEFEGLAKTLAELALNPDNATPFTVVVRGGWGRGKTTLLRRARWMLEQGGGKGAGHRRVKTLWFNAWKYPSEDTVLAGLLGALLDRLEQGDLGDQLARLVASYKVSVLKAVLGLAAPPGLKDLLTRDAPRGRFTPVQEQRAFHDTFRRLFGEVSRVLFHRDLALRDTGGLAEEALWSPETQRKETLAVFLDDLDRCRQGRVMEVLEAINLFLDLPGVCFYLGIDWDRLVAALPDDIARGERARFLEKIVQVGFDLPAVSTGGAEEYIRKLIAGTGLEQLLEARPEEGAGEAGDGVAVVVKALESRHPRHVKRFLNDLSMGLAVLRNAGRLGSGKKLVPAEAVLAWHLLSEILPAERWRDIRALPVNARAFLREEASRKGGEGKEEREELPAEWQRIHRSGLASSHLQTLSDLDDAQLHVLVYLASPAQTELPRRRAVTERFQLDDLESGAWVALPGGLFQMGSEEGEPDERPVHEVELSPFRISRHPVTNAQYAVFMRESRREAPRHWQDGQIPEGKDHHPVVFVSWQDSEVFCAWLTKRVAKESGSEAVRLPTEAQWDYAARGTAGRTYPWGEEEPDKRRANFGRHVGNTTPVGAYPEGATAEGVLDLAGNVWEWCRDWSARYSEHREKDPAGPKSGMSRVLRGGSFLNYPRNLRSAYRIGFDPEYQNENVGFRVVWSSS